MKKLLLGLLLPLNVLFGQEYFPNNEGVKTKELNYQAFENATIHLSSNQVIEKGTLLELNGRIVAVGQNIILPENTRVYDKTGLHIYPSFIDLNSNFGVATPRRASSSGRSAQYEPSRKGYYWNDHILSDYNSIDDYQYDANKAKTLREAGFGIVNTHRANGIHRGTSTLVALSDDSSENKRL